MMYKRDVMRVLGIYDGHNCSSCIVENGKILAAIEEERISRIKYHDGRFNTPPSRSLGEVLRLTNSSQSNIDKISIAIYPPLEMQKRFFRDLFVKQKNPKWIFYFLNYWDRFGPFQYLSPYFYNLWRQRRILKLLKQFNLHKIPIDWIDHHEAHAASVYYLGGKRKALIYTLDGKGDGLCGSIYKGENGILEKIDEISTYHSPGYLYSIVTVGLGYKKMRHEGKITGLAAYGDKEGNAYKLFKNLIRSKEKNFEFSFNRGIYQPPYPSWCDYKYMWKRITKNLDASREDFSAAVQRRTEEIVSESVSCAVDETGLHDICVSGGVFANVKVNQAILGLDNVNSIFICPPMNDGGLSVGAALLTYAKNNSIKFNKLNNVFFGPEYSKENIENELKKQKLKYNLLDDIEKEVAELLAKGKVVARFNGRMEFGPRALGNRSILYQSTDPKVNDWLNKRLNRTEFMPFAPVTLNKYAKKCYKNMKGAEYTSKFMTITFDCTNWMKKNCPAVVHVDGTARPQIVSKKDNPSYYKILDEYRKITGLPTIINTSFNMHEEPIVCSPKDAIRSFKLGHLDYLAIGNCLLKNK